MKSDVLIRVVDRRLRYKVLLEERIRQVEAEIEKASDSVTYVRIAGELEDLWQRGRHNWKHIGWLLRRALGDMPPSTRRDDSTDVPRGGTRGGDVGEIRPIEWARAGIRPQYTILTSIFSVVAQG